LEPKHLGAPPTENGRREVEILHPAWRAFIRFCSSLHHGEIERLKIQDGVPVLAESTTKKVKFTS
jgi:hypothetical protein